ncbi:dihydropteroate synthase [Candidatus Gracilibacteria bacterium]|nr:dihydropteroate synthase [Candidatus Gracilibacteria bacterium]
MKKNNCQIFGILNVTPDSFSDGGKFLDEKLALDQAQKLFDDGADFVDVGGQSTRPGSPDIPWQKEWEREEIILKTLLKTYPNKISLDTFHPETARRFFELGGTILNDVSGFGNSCMRDIAPQFAMIIVNHFPGKTVDEVHEQKICSINQVRDELLFRKEQLLQSGVSASAIVLDPGIGFGKTMELNWELLKFPLLVPNERVLIGHSRKRFLGEKRFEIDTNLCAARRALDMGAAFLRVHDVFEHRKLIFEHGENACHK